MRTNKRPFFKAINQNGEVEEITDLYWFEENGVHDFDGKGQSGHYEIITGDGLPSDFMSTETSDYIEGLEKAVDYIFEEWKNGRLSGPMGDELIKILYDYKER